MRIAISSGHGKYVSGANGYLKEHPEAVRVVDKVYEFLQAAGVQSRKYEDVTSHTQNENLNNLVNWHNKANDRDLDVSIHFNANVTTSKPMGCECWYYSQQEMAKNVSVAIAAAAGWPNRGAKYSDGLFFLMHTNKPSILVEVCFVDSSSDANAYNARFDAICQGIAEAIGGVQEGTDPAPPDLAQFPVWRTSGMVSWFGGPEDTGVAPDEGLAFISSVDQAPEMFLDYQPSGTTGLARRLDPHADYIAQRWDYGVYSKDMLSSGKYFARVTAPKTGRSYLARPMDWGPHEDTERQADVSQGLLQKLGLTTDEVVEVEFPAQKQVATEPVPNVEMVLTADKPVTITVVAGENVMLADG